MTAQKPLFRPRLAFSRGLPPASAEPGAPEPPAPSDSPGLTPEQTIRFRETILPHLDAAYNLARYLTRDATAAEDVVQEAFLRAFRAFPSYRGGAPKAWLFAIVRNCFLNGVAARQRAGRTVVDEGALSESDAERLSNIADPDHQDPEQTLLRRREAQTVRAVIQNLPEPFRETLILRELEELSYKEIAALTGAPIGSVMSRLARARQMLADMLLPPRPGQTGAGPMAGRGTEGPR